MNRTDTNELFPSPMDGECLESAFPAFRWRMPPGGVALLEVANAEGQIVICHEARRNFYISECLLPEGQYHWDIAIAGKRRGWWSFTIGSGAIRQRVPNAQTLLSRLPATGPRLLWLPEERKGLLEKKKWEVEVLQRNVKLALRQGMPPRPRYEEAGDTRAAVYRKEFQRHRKYVDRNLMAAALASYLLENKEAGKFAKQVLLRLASWGTEGLCAVDRSAFDEIGLSHVRTFFCCYDWLYPLFTSAEHQFLKRQLAAYARQMKRYLQRIDFANFPGASHASRLPAYLGVAGLVLSHEEPEAEEWLQEALDLHAAILPHYGDRAGGWAEGAFYASSYSRWALPFFCAVERHSGYPFLQRQEYRNMAHFFLHMGQPDWDIHPFGDGYWCHWNDREWRGFFSQDPFQPFAEWFGPDEARTLSLRCQQKIRWFEMHVADAFLPAPSVDRKADTCAQSRHFSDAGFVSIHTDIAHPESNRALLLRASRHGSGSHQHADQGSFAIISQCHGLITPSGGFNPPEGGPHHSEWTQQTLAHNCLLIGGQGQIPRSPEAVGIVTQFSDDGHNAFVRMNLSSAYGISGRYERTVAFIRPGVIVIADWLDLDVQKELEWRIHTTSGLRLSSQGFEICQSSALLNGRIFSNTPGNSSALEIETSRTPDGRTQQHLRARFIPRARGAIFAFLEFEKIVADVVEASTDQLIFRLSGKEHRLFRQSHEIAKEYGIE